MTDRNSKSKHRVHGLAWSDEKRVEVATADSMGLPAHKIAAVTGVAAGTIKKWRQEEWYQGLLSEIQTEEDREIDGKLTRLVNRSLEVIVDRIENGDYMWNSKENKFVRKPVYMKEAGKIASDLISRRNLLRGKPTSISSKEQTEGKLAHLAEEFARFANAKTIEGELIDATEHEEPTKPIERLEAKVNATQDGGATTAGGNGTTSHA